MYPPCINPDRLALRDRAAQRETDAEREEREDAERELCAEGDAWEYEEVMAREAEVEEG